MTAEQKKRSLSDAAEDYDSYESEEEPTEEVITPEEA
jgi:hypothetical protein